MLKPTNVAGWSATVFRRALLTDGVTRTTEYVCADCGNDMFIYCQDKVYAVCPCNWRILTVIEYVENLVYSTNLNPMRGEA